MTAQTTNVQTGRTIPEWTLGDRMGKALDHAGIGMQEMADYLGVSRNSVSNWVHGRITPSRQTLLLWSMRTGVDLDWIVRSQSDTGWSAGESAQPPGYALRTLRRKHRRQTIPLGVKLMASPHNHPAMPGARHLSLVPDLPAKDQLVLPIFPAPRTATMMKVAR